MRYGAAVNGQDLLDPEIAPLAPTIDLDGLNDELLAQFRVPIPGLGSTEAVVREDVTIPGHPAVTVRVHRPVGASGTLPAVLSIHGGGYVLGSYDMDDPTFEDWCPRFGLVGVSVEYRLAPETAYPGPHDDCFAALRWMHENAEQLGIDPARIRQAREGDLRERWRRAVALRTGGPAGLQTGAEGFQLPAALAFLTGKGKLAAEFDITALAKSAYGAPGDYLLSLSPKVAEPQVKSILFVVNPKTFDVRESVITDGQGNLNNLTFADIKTNSHLPESEFHFAPPPGVRVIDTAKLGK